MIKQTCSNLEIINLIFFYVKYIIKRFELDLTSPSVTLIATIESESEATFPVTNDFLESGFVIRRPSASYVSSCRSGAMKFVLRLT